VLLVFVVSAVLLQPLLLQLNSHSFVFCKKKKNSCEFDVNTLTYVSVLKLFVDLNTRVVGWLVCWKFT
jgi:hypothetical protein